jgi:ankyrin repeat protein
VQELLEALKRDNLVALKKLLEGRDIDLSQDVIVGEEYELDEPDEVPLLFYAVQHGVSYDAIVMLIDHGVDINEVNREGVGALDIAIKYRRMDIVKLCIEHGADITKSHRRSGVTPLILAASFNDIEMVEFLMSFGADADTADKYGMRAVDYAKRMGQKRMLNFLEKLNNE